jgi:hypothetical protein
MWCVHSVPLLEIILTLTNIACLPLLRPLLNKVAENRSTIFATQTRWFTTRSQSWSFENNVDEIPLSQVISDGNHVLSAPSPLLVSGLTTPRNTIRSTECFSVY